MTGFVLARWARHPALLRFANSLRAKVCEDCGQRDRTWPLATGHLIGSIVRIKFMYSADFPLTC